MQTLSSHDAVGEALTPVRGLSGVLLSGTGRGRSAGPVSIVPLNLRGGCEKGRATSRFVAAAATVETWQSHMSCTRGSGRLSRIQDVGETYSHKSHKNWSMDRCRRRCVYLKDHR